MIPILSKNLVLLPLLCFPLFCFSQKGFSEDWQVIKANEHVQVHARRINCPDSANGVFKRNIIFRIRNLAPASIRVSWNYKPWIDGVPANTDGSDPEKYNEYFLPPGGTIEGKCGERHLCEYQSFLDKLEIPVLTDFELTDFNVTLDPGQ